MSRIALVAALPREIASLVRGVRPDRTFLARGIHLYEFPSALVVCAGMGGLRVTLAVEAAMKADAVSTLVSVGLAGGCDPSVAAGTVVAVKRVVDALSGAKYEAQCEGEGAVLVTQSGIANVTEKQRLFAAYGASIVDMEAATVARLAQVHGVGFRAVKAVSDAHDFELGSLSRFSSPHGHFRTNAFALHTALRPHRWRATMRLGADSHRALQALSVAMLAVIAEGCSE